MSRKGPIRMVTLGFSSFTTFSKSSKGSRLELSDVEKGPQAARIDKVEPVTNSLVSSTGPHTFPVCTLCATNLDPLGLVASMATTCPGKRE